MKNKGAISGASVIPLAIGLASFAMTGSRGPATNTTDGPTGTRARSNVSPVFMSGLTSGCVLPFDDIKSDGLEIDQTCSIDGNSGDDTGKRLESEAKNNFCLEIKPISITYDDFKTLEGAADAEEGLRGRLKKSRKDLVGIATSKSGNKFGEGTMVRFVAFLLDAHFSNVGKGELVNCKKPGKETNDIHIELTKDPRDDDACNSVTAEMSPHFRPAAWNELVDAEIKNPVRITGPLFFDGSHHPCTGDKRPSPQRISVWEVQPIYQFEVCKNKSLTACKVDVDSQWIPLDEFLSDTGEDSGD